MQEMGFAYGHGPAAMVGHATVPGKMLPPVGSLQTIMIGPSVFRGYVTNREHDPINNVSTVRMVDWRDRLQDVYLRAAFNMQEDDGRYYHLLPNDWHRQIKTYISRDLGQFDFLMVTAWPPDSVFNTQIAKNVLFSAYSLLTWIGFTYGFNITAENMTLLKLKKSYPTNLDWNNGSTTLGNAIQQICGKCGMQFTCFGTNHMHVTIRGYSENTYTNALVAGMANLCQFGVSSGKIGEELNEQGRRVSIIGDRNKHEWVFPCRANWNPAWTWGMVYGSGIELGALLNLHDLTLDSKVRKLPEAFHDFETWADNDLAGKGALSARQTRQDMTIRDYLEKVAFKAYVVESRVAVTDFVDLVEDDFLGFTKILDRDTLKTEGDVLILRNFPRAVQFDDDTSNFLYPLSRTLVSDSNLQSIVYATTHHIIRGTEFPFAVQYSFLPQSQGVSLDVEEVINPDTGRTEWRVRVFFNSPQFWKEPDKPFDDPRSVSPDLVLVRLSLDKDIFHYVHGEQGLNLRVREQVWPVRSLCQSFIDDVEQSTLIQNFRRDLLKGGVPPPLVAPVTAKQIAERIAMQILAHQAITKSGNFQFEDICGSKPDGLIDTVTVSFNNAPGGGVFETVNFTTGFLDDKEGIQNPVAIRVSRKFKDEEEIAKDRIAALARAMRKDKKLATHAMTVMDTGLHEPGALVGVPMAALAYGKSGVVAVDYPKTVLEAISDDWKGGTVVAMDKPAPEGS